MRCKDLIRDLGQEEEGGWVRAPSEGFFHSPWLDQNLHVFQSTGVLCEERFVVRRQGGRSF